MDPKEFLEVDNTPYNLTIQDIKTLVDYCHEEPILGLALWNKGKVKTIGEGMEMAKRVFDYYYKNKKEK